MNFINPIEILKLQDVIYAGSIDISIIKREKKKLFAEIELSDNGLYNYNGVDLTKSDGIVAWITLLWVKKLFTSYNRKDIVGLLSSFKTKNNPPLYSISKDSYKVKNWASYNEGLKQRGSLTLWIDCDIVDKWKYSGQQNRGGMK